MSYFRPDERLGVFIDGQAVYTTSRDLGFDVDYKALREWFDKQAKLIRAYYYVALVEQQEYTPLKPLTDWLGYNGYALVTKPAKEYMDSIGRRRVKGNIDIEMACDLLDLAPHIDHAVMFSGDADLRRLVESVQRHAVRVTVISSIKTSPPHVGDELRRAADQYIDLDSIKDNFTRRQIEPRVRPMVRPVAEAADSALPAPVEAGGEADIIEDRREGARPPLRRRTG